MSNVEQMIAEIESELKDNILPFWSEKMIDPKGGFYGRMLSDGTVASDALKGAVLNARILWTFSAAYRVYGTQNYLEVAKRAKEYLIEKFYDKQFGGIYWMLNADGEPLDTKKQFYALGFAIYGLSEYYRAHRDVEALDYAIKLYELIERYSYSCSSNGYIEATTRDWGVIEDMRLSNKDINTVMSMNTHLHIIEPYTNLYRVWKSDELKERIKNLITIFIEKIYDSTTGHLKLFFDQDWNSVDAGCSFGHDIEASWLLLEAALEVGDSALIEQVKSVCARIAEASFDGLQSDGSMIYERHSGGKLLTERHWWVQAETVVGLVWLYTHHKQDGALEKADMCWNYIKEHIVDSENGEWFWGRFDDGRVDLKEDKAGMWKCPYHNARMCFEVINELKR